MCLFCFMECFPAKAKGSPALTLSLCTSHSGSPISAQCNLNCDKLKAWSWRRGYLWVLCFSLQESDMRMYSGTYETVRNCDIFPTTFLLIYLCKPWSKPFWECLGVSGRVSGWCLGDIDHPKYIFSESYDQNHRGGVWGCLGDLWGMSGWCVEDVWGCLGDV